MSFSHKVRSLLQNLTSKCLLRHFICWPHGYCRCLLCSVNTVKNKFCVGSKTYCMNLEPNFNDLFMIGKAVNSNNCILCVLSTQLLKYAINKNTFHKIYFSLFKGNKSHSLDLLSPLLIMPPTSSSVYAYLPWPNLLSLKLNLIIKPATFHVWLNTNTHIRYSYYKKCKSNKAYEYIIGFMLCYFIFNVFYFTRWKLTYNLFIWSACGCLCL